MKSHTKSPTANNAPVLRYYNEIAGPVPTPMVIMVSDSKFCVQSEAGNPDRTAIAVVCWMGNMLKVESPKYPRPNFHFIVCFNNKLEMQFCN